MPEIYQTSIVIIDDPNNYVQPLDIKQLPPTALQYSCFKDYLATNFNQHGAWTLTANNYDPLNSDIEFKNGYKVMCAADRIMLLFTPSPKSNKPREAWMPELAKHLYSLAANSIFKSEKMGINFTYEIPIQYPIAALKTFIKEEKNFLTEHLEGLDIKYSQKLSNADFVRNVRLFIPDDSDEVIHLNVNHHYEYLRAQANHEVPEKISEFSALRSQSDILFEAVTREVGLV